MQRPYKLARWYAAPRRFGNGHRNIPHLVVPPMTKGMHRCVHAELKAIPDSGMTTYKPRPASNTFAFQGPEQVIPLPYIDYINKVYPTSGM